MTGKPEMPRDEELSQLYQQLPHIEPHAALDESVLAFARRNTVKPEARSWAWIWRLSLPLTAVAALSLWWVFRPNDVSAPSETPGPVAMVAAPPDQSQLKKEEAPFRAGGGAAANSIPAAANSDEGKGTGLSDIPLESPKDVMEAESTAKAPPRPKRKSAKMRPSRATEEDVDEMDIGGLGTRGRGSIASEEFREDSDSPRSDRTVKLHPVCALFHPQEFKCEWVSTREGKTIVKVEAMRILVPWIRGLGFQTEANKDNEFKHLDGRRLRLEYLPQGQALIIFYDENP